MTRPYIVCFLALLAVTALLAVIPNSRGAGDTGGAALTPPTVGVKMPARIGSRVIITRCGPEDGCRIDYRNGRWFLRRWTP